MNYTELNKPHVTNLVHNNNTLWGLPIYFEKRTAELVVFLINGILISGVSAFGIFGNTLSVYVLSRRKMRSSLSVLLLGLTVCDLSVCVLIFLCTGFPYVLWQFQIGAWYIRIMCSVYRYYFLLWRIGKLIWITSFISIISKCP